MLSVLRNVESKLDKILIVFMAKRIIERLKFNVVTENQFMMLTQILQAGNFFHMQITSPNHNRMRNENADRNFPKCFVFGRGSSVFEVKQQLQL